MPIFFAAYPAKKAMLAIPIFFARYLTKIFIFGYPAKNADFVVGSRSSRVFLFEEPLLFCFPIGRHPDVFAGKTIDFLPGTRQKMPILSSGAARFLCFPIWGAPPLFSYLAIFCRVPGKKCRFCRREPVLLCFPI